MTTGTTAQRTPEPWKMTRAEYAKAVKPVRSFQRYTSDERASQAASFRLGHMARQRIGEFYYTVPGVDLAFNTRGAALLRGHREVVEKAIAEGKTIPARVLSEYSELVAS